MTTLDHENEYVELITQVSSIIESKPLAVIIPVLTHLLAFSLAFTNDESTAAILKDVAELRQMELARQKANTPVVETTEEVATDEPSLSTEGYNI